MKILQILYYPGQGGAEQYAYLLAKEALKDGHEIDFVFGEEGPFVKRIKELGCKTAFIKMRSPFDPLAIRELAKLFEKTKPDIVHTHFLRENFLAISASKLSPVGAIFTTVHRIEPKTELQAKFNKFYSKGLSKFIAVSEVVKEYLKNEDIKDNKIVLIPNGVKIEKFNRSKVRKELSLTEKDKIISCVARFTEEKGQINLIKAFSKIKDKKTKLVLVGDGELLEKAKKLAIKLAPNRVIFTGGRDKGYEIIGLSNLYVQPSKIEAFGLSVVEAMLQKIPILLSDIPSFCYFTENGQRGDLFKTKNPADLTKKIDELLKEKEIKKINLAYKFAKERFTSEIVWAKTKALYEHALARKGLKSL